MNLPAWADENLYVDECALLEGGVDWSNPVHVLLLRLARERRLHRSARKLLREIEDAEQQSLTPDEVAAIEDAEQQSLTPDEVAAIDKRILERHRDRPPAPPHKCEWELLEDGALLSGFPRLRCSVCRVSTDFYGKLWDGADGSASGMNGPPGRNTA